MQPVASPLTMTCARADPLMPARRAPRLPRQLGWFVLLDALGHRHDGLDAVEASGVLPEQLALDGRRHLVPCHELESLPGVLGIVMRVVRGPQPHVLVLIPHAIDRLLVMASKMKPRASELSMLGSMLNTMLLTNWP